MLEPYRTISAMSNIQSPAYRRCRITFPLERVQLDDLRACHEPSDLRHYLWMVHILIMSEAYHVWRQLLDHRPCPGRIARHYLIDALECRQHGHPLLQSVIRCSPLLRLHPLIPSGNDDEPVTTLSSRLQEHEMSGMQQIENPENHNDFRPRLSRAALQSRHTYSSDSLPCSSTGLMVGNRMTSFRLCEPVSIAVSRSIPMPNPAVGGSPTSNASI